MLLPEYQSNDIENCLVSFPGCPMSFSNLPGLNWAFLPNEIGDFLQRAHFENLLKRRNNKQDLPLFFFLAMMTLVCFHVFCPLGK